MSNDKNVNWNIFDINPIAQDQKLSGNQTIREYKKYNGTPAEFVDELDNRFGWSGVMCELTEKLLNRHMKE